MAEEKTTRRTFLQRLLQGTVAAGALGVFGALFAYLFPPRRTFLPTKRQQKVGKASEFQIGKAKSIIFKGEPLLVLRLRAGFVALSAICTHRGCIVAWDEKRQVIACPCHGGIFDAQGNVLAGLPTRSLRPFRAEVVNGELYVAEP